MTTFYHPPLLCLIAFLASCTSTSKDKDSSKDTDKSKNDPIAVGIVEFVNPDQKFVLIRMQSRIPMPIGQNLTALDATGNLTQLTVSPERKGTHVTADIKAGNPRPGNLVIFQPDPTALPPIAAPTANPSNSAVNSDGAIEWRDGQPPPITIPSTTPPIQSTNPTNSTTPLPIIPLDPLQEEPPTPTNP